MKKIKFLFLVVTILSFSFCAKKGRPNGGPIDEDAPLFVTADPPYETINFDKKEIRLYFNENIVIKDLNDQLIVSPPLNPNNPSLITPQGSPSKYITIKIVDTLLKNTTYTFDFGSSIEDNNEGNKLESFKYVFSTGSFIDSLSVKGNVKNSYKSESIKDIRLLLYRLDSTFTDSTVYKTKPNYVTSTLDSSIYKFTNLRKGKYHLVAIKDAASNYIFNPKNDDIGFYNKPIELPKDSVIDFIIPVFKEKLSYNFKRAQEFKKGQLIFGYEGVPKDLKIEILSDVPEDFKTLSIFEKDKDTLNFWHSPIERDSLIFKVIKDSFIDTVVVRLRKKELDSLTISPSINSILEYADTLFFRTNNPITQIDSSKISFVNKDTLKIPFSSFISTKENKVGILFKKEFETKYSLNLYPNAFRDIFGQTNDSIDINFRTKSIEDYGDISLSINNPKSIPVIIQLTDNDEKTIRQQIVNSTTTISFLYLKPKDYKVRIIYDVNKNGKWDTGNYLKRLQPETVEYFKNVFTIRSFYSINEVITIKK